MTLSKQLITTTKKMANMMGRIAFFIFMIITFAFVGAAVAAVNPLNIATITGIAFMLYGVLWATYQIGRTKPTKRVKKIDKGEIR